MEDHTCMCVVIRSHFCEAGYSHLVGVEELRLSLKSVTGNFTVNIHLLCRCAEPACIESSFGASIP